MKTNYARSGEKVSLFIGELIMSCNEEDIRYDNWYMYVDQLDNYKTGNIQNVLFRFEYSHNNHEGINDLERKVRESIIDSSEEIENLRKEYMEHMGK